MLQYRLNVVLFFLDSSFLRHTRVVFVLFYVLWNNISLPLKFLTKPKLSEIPEISASFSSCLYFLRLQLSTSLSLTERNLPGCSSSSLSGNKSMWKSDNSSKKWQTQTWSHFETGSSNGRAGKRKALLLLVNMTVAMATSISSLCAMMTSLFKNPGFASLSI